MASMIGPLIAIVFIVIAANIFIVFRRLKTNPVRKSGTRAMDEKEAAELRDSEIKRRFQQEFEDDLRRVELRNKTLDLYEQVRKRARDADNTDNSC